MLAQDLEEVRGQRARVRARSPFGVPISPSLDGADRDRAAIPVDVAPLQRDRLPDPQPRADQDLGERPVPVLQASR